MLGADQEQFIQFIQFIQCIFCDSGGTVPAGQVCDRHSPSEQPDLRAAALGRAQGHVLPEGDGIVQLQDGIPEERKDEPSPVQAQSSRAQPLPAALSDLLSSCLPRKSPKIPGRPKDRAWSGMRQVQHKKQVELMHLSLFSGGVGEPLLL